MSFSLKSKLTATILILSSSVQTVSETIEGLLELNLKELANHEVPVITKSMIFLILSNLVSYLGWLVEASLPFVFRERLGFTEYELSKRWLIIRSG